MFFENSRVQSSVYRTHHVLITLRKRERQRPFSKQVFITTHTGLARARENIIFLVSFLAAFEEAAAAVCQGDDRTWVTRKVSFLEFVIFMN